VNDKLRDSQAAAAQGGSGTVGSAEQPCPLKKHWLTIELVGEDGSPVPNEKYRVILPDGSVREGALNGRGTATFEELKEGECQVSFPGLDSEAWEPAS
jgi:hypothetical protein